jgi:hypothetical protein
MKQNTLIILSIALIFAGCNKTDTVIITKAEYEQLKRDTVVPEYPKLVTIPIPNSDGWLADFYVVMGSDGHEYLTNEGSSTANWKVLIHNPNCKYCYKKDTLNH